MGVNRVPVKIASADGFAHTVEIGGCQVQNDTTHLSLEIDAKTRLPVLTLRLLVIGGMEAETLALARVDDETAQALKAMGWTPPGSGD